MYYAYGTLWLGLADLEALRTESRLSSDVITTGAHADQPVHFTHAAEQQRFLLEKAASCRRLKCREIDVVLLFNAFAVAGVCVDWAGGRGQQCFHQLFNGLTGVKASEVRRLTDHFWHKIVTMCYNTSSSISSTPWTMKKRATLFSIMSLWRFFSIFITFIPVETGRNTLQFTYLMAWWHHHHHNHHHIRLIKSWHDTITTHVIKF